MGGRERDLAAHAKEERERGGAVRGRGRERERERERDLAAHAKRADALHHVREAAAVLILTGGGEKGLLGPLSLLRFDTNPMVLDGT